MKSPRSRRFQKTSLLACILAIGLSQQGCLAAAWLAVVGADSMRTSHVSFAPFEASWVSEEKSTEIAEGLSLSSVAVLSVEGDADMGRRLAGILRQQTALRVEVAIDAAHEPASYQHDQASRATAAQDVSRELAVDAVLFGHVSSGLPPHPSDWGWKEEESRRLFLYLVDRDGHLLWKDELPFTVVTGSKPPLEGAVEASLGHHLMDHVRDLGLDTLGYLPHKTS